MIFQMMAVFLAGILEDFVNSWHIKSISRGNAVMTGVSDAIHVGIWYFILRSFVENLNNIFLVVMYALGNAIGSYLYVKYVKKTKQEAKNES